MCARSHEKVLDILSAMTWEDNSTSLKRLQPSIDPFCHFPYLTCQGSITAIVRMQLILSRLWRLFSENLTYWLASVFRISAYICAICSDAWKADEPSSMDFRKTPKTNNFISLSTLKCLNPNLIMFTSISRSLGRYRKVKISFHTSSVRKEHVCSFHSRCIFSGTLLLASCICYTMFTSPRATDGCSWHR